jgi:IS30 family transposase
MPSSIRVGFSSGRYLTFSEREEIALPRAQGAGVGEIARRLGRARSTISRELRRNAATRRGRLEYRASTAQWKAELMARRPKPAKLVTTERLRAAALRISLARRSSLTSAFSRRSSADSSLLTPGRDTRVILGAADPRAHCLSGAYPQLLRDRPHRVPPES